MKKSKLLSEVLADAKAVRETAYKNAMETLNETFQPTIQRMISQKLAEDEVEDDVTEPTTEAPVTENDYIDDGDDGTPATNLKEMDEDEPVVDDAPVEDEEDTLELESVIAELEGEMEDEDEPVTEMEDEDEKEPVTEMEDEDAISDEELDEIISEIEDDAPTTEVAPDSTALQAENAKLKEDLKEAYKAVLKQKEVIKEVNLLNSKLMFSTKLIRNFSLTENQKVTILEAFDRADSANEAKIVYVTIAETLNNAGAKKRQRLQETASKATPAVTTLTESANDNIVANSRWQTLAGIK